MTILANRGRTDVADTEILQLATAALRADNAEAVRLAEYSWQNKGKATDGKVIGATVALYTVNDGTGDDFLTSEDFHARTVSELRNVADAIFPADTDAPKGLSVKARGDGLGWYPSVVNGEIETDDNGHTVEILYFRVVPKSGAGRPKRNG